MKHFLKLTYRKNLLNNSSVGPDLQRKLLKIANSPARVAIFSGTGTSGKTLAAYFLSTEMGLEIYRISLSQVVNKYIGETEKNLEKILNRAEGKDWILFFDEADALFGKRTEVKDAHDRYANIEVSYLLKKIESLGCLVILSTNQGTDLSEETLKRFKNVIHFSPVKKSL